ncbi:neprilysin-21-like isoform X1 [Amphibalanus amphitrite]|uniref:neprilysin-21-like isoform X1 n=2 Tax=Amphibalanus amphitrite TaxID=1232801 RepID=UPI001C926F51|nr:neprilysin-21-like isoform X1 [Amphibalanus amphitrite]
MTITSSNGSPDGAAVTTTSSNGHLDGAAVAGEVSGLPAPGEGAHRPEEGQTTNTHLTAFTVSALVSEIRDELIRGIEKRNIQTPSPIYQTALEKLRRLRSFIAASDSFWDDHFINSHSASLGHRLHMQEPSHHRLLRLMKTLTSIGDTFSDQYLASDFQAEDTIWSYVVQPYSPNAYYLTDRNAVVIPLAFLSEPYLFDDVPRYITMAALGTTIAHELLHSVGVTGFYFNSAGELHSLSEDTEHQLSDLRHCVRHQFTRNLSREVEISGLLFSAQPNGELTLDENLSDHDGLALAWRTYHRWQHRHRHSPEPRLPGVQGSVRQTFLLALAQTYCAKVAPVSYITSAEVDTHLPNPERINAMMRHFPGFAAAFGCPVGSQMRPEHQCSPIWLPL